MCTSTLDLKTLLLHHTESYLGTYTIEDGGSIPAVWVGNPSDELEVQGIELVIQPLPEVKHTWSYPKTYARTTWYFDYYARSQTDLPNLYAIQQALSISLPCKLYYLTQSDDIGNYHRISGEMTTYNLLLSKLTPDSIYQ